MANELKTKGKLSRQEKIKRNPVIWILLLVITLVFLGLLVFPEFMDWREKRSSINILESKIRSFEKENILLKQEAEKKEIEFNLAASPYLTREKQIFPETVDIVKVAKILEIYALQLENLDSKLHDSYFELSKISFSKSKRVKGKNYATTTISLVFSTDRQNLESFVRFLQTGKLSARFKKGKDNGQIQLVDYKFLEDNLIPLAQIDSIKAVPEKSRGDNDSNLSVKMSVSIFSQN
ncbi:hypothetical protein K9M41_03980 [Candidatus Gracilibacteria bacterium]|nr:hypothetical protein [Candidatus Gracilibacteria bacterium]